MKNFNWYWYWKIWNVINLNQVYFHFLSLLNWLRPSDPYVHQPTRPSLVQIMACHLAGPKTLSKPMVLYCQLDPKGHNSVKFYFKFKFPLKEMHLKILSAKWRPSCLSLNVFTVRLCRQLKSFLLEGKDLLILHSQYHGCWWHGNTRNHDVRSPDIDIKLSIRRVDIVNQIMFEYHWTSQTG